MATRASYEFLRDKIYPGDVFVDIGASEGLYTEMAAGLVGSGGYVYAIEPERSNLLTLYEKFKWFENVAIEEYAVSDFEGSAALYLGKTPGLHSLKSGLPNRDAGIQTVQVKRLDDFRWTGRTINGVKIDVEGSELEVLIGGERVLRDPFVVYIAIDVHPSLGVDVKAIERKLIDYGFKLVSVQNQHNELFGIKGNT